MHEQLRVGDSVRLIRAVGERRAGTSGTVVGYYVDSGRAVVTFADGTAEVPGDAIGAAAEDAPIRRDPSCGEPAGPSDALPRGPFLSAAEEEPGVDVGIV